MKIIFVTREGYNLAGGRIRSYNFAKELSGRGIKTEVLSYADSLGAKDGVHERSMSALEKVKYNVVAYQRLSREKGAIIVLQRINYHSFAPILNAIIKKNSLVLDIDDWEIREDPRYIFGFYPTSKAEYFMRKISGLADFCIAGSIYLKEYIYQFNKKVYYIPSCVDTDLFHAKGKTEKSGVIKFAWIGTMHRQGDVENVKFIVDCFQGLAGKFKDVSLDIVGDGIYRDEILKYISNYSLGDYVNLIGWIPPDEMPFYLENVDVGLFPLIQKTKFNLSKSPTKLFEYMAMEKPTVSSCIGEASIIIEDGKDGFLAIDRTEFLDKMEELVKDSALRKEMGANARKKILQNYSLNLAGNRLFALLINKYGAN